MTRVLKQGLLVCTGLLVTGIASAHPSILHGGGLYYGLLHPLTGLDHLLALFAAGLLASRYSRGHAAAMLAMMLLMMAVGAVIGMYDLVLPLVEVGIMGSLVFMGVVIAVGKRLSVVIAMPALAIIGSLHGYAHGHEMTPTVNTILYFAGFLVSSLAIQCMGMLAGQVVRQHSDKVYRFGGGVIVLFGLGLLGSGL
jgi:urease accessory protein